MRGKVPGMNGRKKKEKKKFGGMREREREREKFQARVGSHKTFSYV